MNNLFSVNVPVIDLRKSPFSQARNYEKDHEQESQLIYNECVGLISKKQEWAYIEAIEQPHKNSRGYCGWIPINTLVPLKKEVTKDVCITSLWGKITGKAKITVPFGSTFKALSIGKDTTEILLPGGFTGIIFNSDLSKETTIAHARKFLDSPYLWGGRSAYQQNHQKITGVDCSGLIGLLYRVKGINLPRNAVDQWKSCKAISPQEVREGDLAFSSSKGSEDKIDHVMLCCGNGKLIEAAMSVGKVHEISIEEKKELFPQDTFYFGRPYLSMGTNTK